jgi:hypothetical protein
MTRHRVQMTSSGTQWRLTTEDGRQIAVTTMAPSAGKQSDPGRMGWIAQVHDHLLIPVPGAPYRSEGAVLEAAESWIRTSSEPDSPIVSADHIERPMAGGEMNVRT